MRNENGHDIGAPPDIANGPRDLLFRRRVKRRSSFIDFDLSFPGRPGFVH